MANLNDLSSKVQSASSSIQKKAQSTVNQANKLLNSASGTLSNVFGSSLKSLANTFPTISSIFKNVKNDSSILALMGGNVLKGSLETNHKLQSLLSSASSAIASPVSFISKSINDVVKSATTLAASTGMKLLSGIGSNALGYIGKAVGYAINTATDLTKAIGSITGGLSRAISSVTSGIGNFVSSIIQPISSTISNFMSALTGGIGSSLNFGGDLLNPLMDILNGAAGMMLNINSDSIYGGYNGYYNENYNYNVSNNRNGDSAYKALTKNGKDNFTVTGVSVSIEKLSSTTNNPKTSTSSSTSKSKKSKSSSNTNTTKKKGTTSTTTTTKKSTKKATTTTTTKTTQKTSNNLPSLLSFLDSDSSVVSKDILKLLDNYTKSLIATTSMTANNNLTQRKMRSLAETIDKIVNNNLIAVAGSEEAVQEKIAKYTVATNDATINNKNASNGTSTALYKEAKDLCPYVTNNKTVDTSLKDKYNVLMNMAAENGETNLIKQLASCQTDGEEDYFDEVTVKALKDAIDTIISNGDADTYLAIQEMVGQENIVIDKTKLLALAANIVDTPEQKKSYKKVLTNFNLILNDILSPNNYQMQDNNTANPLNAYQNSLKYIQSDQGTLLTIHLNVVTQYEIAKRLLEQVTNNQMAEYYMEYLPKFNCYGFTWRYKGERVIHHLPPDYCLVYNPNKKYSVIPKVKFNRCVLNCNSVVAVSSTKGGKSLVVDSIGLNNQKMAQSAFYLYSQKSA